MSEMRLLLQALATILACGVHSSLAQTIVFSDNFDPPAPGDEFCGYVSGWPVLPGKINSNTLTSLAPSTCSSRKNHTGDPTEGGSAFEPDGDPGAFASYRQFDPQTGVLHLSAWIWDDVESRKDHGAGSPFGLWPVNAPIRGMVGLTTEPGPPTSNSPSRLVYPYDDYAFIGVEAIVTPNTFPGKPNPNDPDFDPYDPQWVEQYVYRWWTKADGWNLTHDPNTGKPVPRRVDFSYQPSGAEDTPQTWRHVEIVIRPYTGQVGDIKFYIDGVLVGEGRREPGFNNQGYDLTRVQLGTRFPMESDTAPTYSYEHFWFDDVELSVSEAPPICPEVRFDTDDDDDVDQEDFGAFQLCYTGPNPPPGIFDFPACRCLDADSDQDVDSDDLGAFQQCSSGPAIPADPTCDDGLPGA